MKIMGNRRGGESPGRVSRTDTSAVEPRYLDLLEEERHRWWSSENFDTWKNLYISEYARGFYVIDAIRKYVSSFPLENARVLDIGCGDAGVIIAFAEAGADAAGVEISWDSLRRAAVRAEEHGVTVALLAGVAESLPFEDGRFDLVILDNVLEHVQDREHTLGEIHRVLRPGGLLYMVTPKPFALYNLWNDPHYDLAGLVLMPRWLQVWYFERVRGGGKGTYDVGVIPTRRKLHRMLREARFSLIVPPRKLWINYLRHRISRPEEIRPGVKRRLAAWVTRQEWLFRGRLPRWFWDISLGSNFFLAQRDE
jgi:ubiquinone/menaquinone biosynthesis C-methylase UbiE